MTTRAHSDAHFPEAEARETHVRPQTERRPGEVSWSVAGILAGALGATVIAVFFLIVDVLAGRALWTPTALGTALFLGERVGADAAPSLPLVLGYTAAHGAVFVSIGMMAAFALVERRRVRPVGGVVLAALLFGVFEILILGFLQFAAPDLVGTVTVLKVTAANLLASGAMAGFLSWMTPRVAE